MVEKRLSVGTQLDQKLERTILIFTKFLEDIILVLSSSLSRSMMRSKPVCQSRVISLKRKLMTTVTSTDNLFMSQVCLVLLRLKRLVSSTYLEISKMPLKVNFLNKLLINSMVSELSLTNCKT